MRRARIRISTLAVVLLVGCAAPPDLSKLPPLRLKPPGSLLRQVRAGVTLSGNLATACAPTEGRRLVGVVIDNDPHARPQSGLASACVIYEVPTEAQIPRFLAVFRDAGPEEVGPIRSVRPAFLEIAEELGAVVVHAGQSVPAFLWIRSHRYPAINQFWVPQPFWRVRSRRMPHNLYGSVMRVRAVMAQRGYDRPPPSPQPAALPYVDPEGPAAARITIGFLRGFEAEFVYENGRYIRFTAGRPHLDARTGSPVAVHAVIIQFVPWRGWRSGRVDVSEVGVVGEGKAFVFAFGRVVEARWMKPREASPTAFVDRQGRGLRLPPGPLWVSLVPIGTRVGFRPTPAP
jgi:hypothetical protein